MNCFKCQNKMKELDHNFYYDCGCRTQFKLNKDKVSIIDYFIVIDGLILTSSLASQETSIYDDNMFPYEKKICKFDKFHLPKTIDYPSFRKLIYKLLKLNSFT